MRLRTLLTALLVAFLAVPVMAVTLFQDVPVSHPHHQAVQWASNLNPPLVEGYPDGRFQPDKTISRSAIDKVIDNLAPQVLANDMSRSEFIHRLWQGFSNLPTAEEPATTSTTSTVEVADEEAVQHSVLQDYRRRVKPVWDITIDNQDVVTVSVEVKDATYPLRVGFGIENPGKWLSRRQTAPKRFEGTFQCTSRLAGQELVFDLQVRYEDPGAGLVWGRLKAKYWTAPDCATPHPVLINASAYVRSVEHGRTRLYLLVAEDNRSRPEHRWQYRIRTDVEDCYNSDWQSPPTGNRELGRNASALYIWDYHDCLVHTADEWWIEFRWPDLGEERSTHRCFWDIPVDCAMNGEPIVAYERSG